MKKLAKRLAVVLMICAMAFAMTACGEIDMNKIKGDWTISTINGQSPADFAAANGVQEWQVMKNYTVTDKTFTMKAADGTVDCPIEVKSDGFNFTLAGATGGCAYDEKADTLSYSIKVGDTETKYVLKKGTSSIEAPAPEAPAEEGGEEQPAEGGEEGGEEVGAEGGEEGAEE